MKVLDISEVERRAKILGASSAAAKALEQYHQRIAMKFDSVPIGIMDDGHGMLIIGPLPADRTDG